jgi:hypothetical protein
MRSKFLHTTSLKNAKISTQLALSIFDAYLICLDIECIDINSKKINLVCMQLLYQSIFCKNAIWDFLFCDFDISLMIYVDKRLHFSRVNALV